MFSSDVALELITPSRIEFNYDTDRVYEFFRSNKTLPENESHRRRCVNCRHCSAGNMVTAPVSYERRGRFIVTISALRTTWRCWSCDGVSTHERSSADYAFLGLGEGLFRPRPTVVNIRDARAC